MTSHRVMVEQLQRRGFLKTPRIIAAFTAVPRDAFVPDRLKDQAYRDRPLPIGFGQTISAPHMNAWMTELLDPKKTDIVLEVGGGSGYQAAILSKLVKQVYSIELDGRLVTQARTALKQTDITNVTMILGDGATGYPKHAPYKKILLSCGAAAIPEALLAQLAVGGILIGPIGGTWSQELTRVTKQKTGFKTETFGSCVFVPLRRHGDEPVYKKLLARFKLGDHQDQQPSKAPS
ncbi:MAG: protein-L-isoaspartate(D-aspartate) O-methyltransferase [Nanoarchaeota archaeon]|nr:protein-L-isoaspartate(D-aspartate) O-methyltransferase [Nanoarchaeota archaeon]